MKPHFLKAFSTLSVALIVAMGVSALPASAQVLNTGVNDFGAQTALGNGGSGGLIGIIANIINIGLGLLGILVVLYMLYGGFMWMTSGGDAEKVAKAKRIIVQTIIGLAITLSAWGIAVFVINAIGGATGANVEGSGGTGGTGGGGGFSGPGPNAFVVQGIAPAGNGQNRNTVVRVVLNKPVDPATAQGSVRIAFAGQDIPGTVQASGSTLEFIPQATCPAPNSNLNCLDENTDYTVTVATSLVAADSTPLTCGGLAPACNANFTTGSIVDTTAPTGNLTGPADGVNFNVNDGITFQSQVADNLAVSKVDYFADGALAVSDGAQALLTSWTSSRNWKPATVTLGKVYRLSGRVFDTATNSADLSGSVNVVARGPNCFNGMQDADETGLDCGGASCGACLGGACSANTDCASGTCANGVCVAQPIIQSILADNGAPGNFITITGQNFGTGGQVKFLGGAGDADDVIAALACSGVWTSGQIVVVVPDTAKTGPMSVTTSANLIDTTSDSRGPQLTFTLNDVKRPNLCSLSPMSGKVGVNVVARGESFGAQATVKIGSLVENQLAPVSDTEINFSIPSLPDATYPVTVTTATGTSNPVNFRVATPQPQNPPTIVSVTPATGPIGQYITLQGSNFGTSGTVRFVRGSEFANADVTFPAICGTQFWQSNTVIVKVPSKMSDNSDVTTGNFTLVLNRSSGDAATSTNSVAFSVTSGTPTPGVCRIDPTSGPVNTPVKFYGDAFGTTPGTVAFNGASATTSTEWGVTQLLTKVPAGATSGEVRVVTSAAAQSNPSFFQVGSCQENPGLCGEGTQCCENGSCSATCSVAPAIQTYGWRFSTGRIPQVPKLLTQCDAIAGTQIPSPSPSAARAGGNQVCTNAIVTAVFDHELDAATVNGSTIRVLECEDATCTTVTPKAGTVMPYASMPEAFAFVPQTTWTAAKTYLVEVTTNLKSATSATVLGSNAVVDTACNRGTGATAVTNNAFCWKFTAGATQCAAAALAVAPNEVLATEPYDPANVETEVKFQAQPLADPRTCLALNSAGVNYTWESSNTSIASILAAAGATASAAPTRETGNSPIQISATTVPTTGAGVTGDANLSIRFARPRVVSYEPNCQDACVNSALVANFNTAMNPSSMDIQLMLCSDADCKPETRVGNITTGLTLTATADKKTFSVSPQNLVRGSYYRALIPAQSGANCKGCSMAGISLAEEGANFQIGNANYFSWIFRTKNDATLCTISSVDVEPLTALVPGSGSATVKYAAIPRSNPDACSATGQALDPWSYDWAWSVAIPDVAGELMNASGVGVVKSGTLDASGKYVQGVNAAYTAQCLKRGADTALGVTAKCGNGVWEKTLGESCDDGNILDGDGCTKTCLIEAFTNANVWNRGGVTGSCGDERVQRSSTSGVGEECDDGVAGSSRCTAQCKATGASAGVCGNGSVDPGESCDDGNTTSGDGCSNQCLSEGSVSNISVCGDARIDANEECDNIAVGSANATQVWAACNHQTCLWSGRTACTAGNTAGCCGNSTRDLGEQCDDGNHVANDGCSASCRLEGSSAFYSAPSFCGDGVTGVGEATGAEATINRTVTDPIQYMRRIANPVAPYTTLIRATTRGVTGSATFTVESSGLGGNQCVIQTSPSCAESSAACEAAGGTCENSTGGARCVIQEATNCSVCAAAGGTCVETKPELVIQCGTNVSPSSIPSPSPLVGANNTVTTMNSDVCTNALISGEFNVDMEPSSVVKNIVVYDCGTGDVGGDCAAGTLVDSEDATYMDPDNKVFHVKPIWQTGHVYMVAIKTGVASASGAAAEADKLMLGAGCGKVGEPVHACWQFKVGTTTCAPSAVSVGLSPNPSTQLGQTVQASAAVLNDRCLEISNTGYTFAWTSSATNIANFNPANPTTGEASLTTAANGTTDVSAKINEAPLITGQSTLTVGIIAETCPAGQGTDAQGHCADRPRVTATMPPNGVGGDAAADNTKGVPRNAMVGADFNMPMRATSLTASGAFKVEYEGACGANPPANPTQNPSSLSSWCQTPIAGTLETVKDQDGKVIGLKFMPSDFLPPLKWHRITIAKTAMSEAGVTLAAENESDFTSYFRTAARIAPLTGARIDDSDTTNPGSFNDPAKSSRPMSAVALGRTSDFEDDFEIFPVPASYAWEWSWGPETVEAVNYGVNATARISSQPTASPSAATVTAVAPSTLSNGGLIYATAKITTRAEVLTDANFFESAFRAITVGDNRTGILFINVFPCANPWPIATDASSFPWKDDDTGVSFYYCRDSGAGLLPELRVQKVTSAASNDGVLREFLFIAGAGSLQTSDAIGLRVIMNPLHLPLADWYRSKGFTGTPQEAQIDGYDALVDGRTLYVSGANLSGDNLYTNIYVFSYNVDAKADSLNIFDQIKKNIRFNPQFDNTQENLNVCVSSPLPSKEILFRDGKIIGCDADAACLPERTAGFPDAVCASAKSKLSRDVRRLSDFRTMSNLVGGVFQQTSQVPGLASGSFLRSYSTSVWPSWNSELAAATGSASMPADPKNNIICGDTVGFESTTCWNQTDQIFSCAEGSQIYSYRGLGTTKSAMGIAFETDRFPKLLSGEDGVGVCEVGSPNAGEACSLNAPGFTCGLLPNEVAQTYKCVDAFAEVDVPLVLDPAGVCSSKVGASARCGDSIVSEGEVCEIGQFGSAAACNVNGKTGTQITTCNNSCTGFVPTGACAENSCGNGRVDLGVCSNDPAKLCSTKAECGGSPTSIWGPWCFTLETCDDGANNGQQGYCNATCSGRGASCGDGVVGAGEQCDCAAQNGVYAQTCSNAGANGCSASCQLGAPRCGDGTKQPQEQCEVGEVKVEQNTCPGVGPTGRTLIKKFTCAPTSCTWSTGQCVEKGACGDGVQDAGEECDDANTSDGDSCTSQCKLNVCGDGKISAGIEECDDGDRNGQSCGAPYGGTCNFCSTQCRLRTVSGGICGNNKAETGEMCDGSDYGGKICVGGDVPSSACSADNECGTGGQCVAQFCLNGLRCKAYSNTTTPDVLTDGTVLREWLAPTLDFSDRSGRKFCSNDPSKACNANGDCGGSNTCNTISEFTLGNTTTTPSNNFAVVCDGFVTPSYSGSYTFKMLTDDQGRLIVDNRTIIDSWVAQNSSAVQTGSISLTAGKRYPIHIDHREQSGEELFRLMWQNISEPLKVIPAGALSYAPDANLSCTVGGTANNQNAKGICIGGMSGTTSTDGTTCTANATCGTGGVCSFVPGVCFNPATLSNATNDTNKISSCRTSDDCSGNANNTTCGAGVCNGGLNNGKTCAQTAQCGTGGTCSFAKCNQACSAFCPTQFEPVALTFKAIDSSSKCTAGASANVGGLCSQDQNCNKTACSANSPNDCTGGTRCINNKCEFVRTVGSTTCPFGQFVKPGTSVCSPCAGYVNADGTCAMCAPGTSSKTSVAMGNTADISTVACTQGTCTGGIYTSANLTRTCLQTPDCLDLPNKAWLEIPACRALPKARVDISAAGWTKQPLNVVFITDNTASMMSPYNGSEGSYLTGFDCNNDGNTNNDSRMRCAINNLVGMNSTSSGTALDQIFSYDQNLTKVALINFGNVDNAGYLEPKESWTSADLTANKNPASDKAFVKVDSLSGQVLALKRPSAPANMNQIFFNYSDLASVKTFIRTEYSKLEPNNIHPGSCPDNGAFELAGKLLAGKPGKKVVIVLSDACDGDNGRASVLAKAKTELKAKGIETYAISYGLPKQGWQLAEWSDDCSNNVAFSELKAAFQPNGSTTYSTASCSPTGHFFQTSSTQTLSTIYGKIVDQIKLAQVNLWYPGINTSVTLAPGNSRELDTSYLRCDPNATTRIPLTLEFSGYGSVQLSNAAADYCPASP